MKFFFSDNNDDHTYNLPEENDVVEVKTLVEEFDNSFQINQENNNEIPLVPYNNATLQLSTNNAKDENTSVDDYNLDFEGNVNDYDNINTADSIVKVDHKFIPETFTISQMNNNNNNNNDNNNSNNHNNEDLKDLDNDNEVSNMILDNSEVHIKNEMFLSMYPDWDEIKQKIDERTKIKEENERKKTQKRKLDDFDWIAKGVSKRYKSTKLDFDVMNEMLGTDVKPSMDYFNGLGLPTLKIKDTSKENNTEQN